MQCFNDYESKDCETQVQHQCSMVSFFDTLVLFCTRFWETYGETVVLSAGQLSGTASLVSREPGELPTVYLERELTVIGKLEQASDVVISLPTVSRVHARIRKTGENYYLADLNSRNGTSVNGRMLGAEEEYFLQDEDQVDFAQARYVFLRG